MKNVHDITLSIVSHSHNKFIELLLSDIDNSNLRSAEIIITINIPEDEAYLNRFSHLKLLVLRNEIPIGFGENHNNAFSYCNSSFFIVLNPDIRIFPEFNISFLLTNFIDTRCGVCAPLVLSELGFIEDSARKFPGFLNLLWRRFSGSHTLNYEVGSTPIVVDWVAGMFMIFQAKIYSKLNGFNPQYFLYFEDVDICHRLKELNLYVIYDPRTSVVHNARRDSGKKLVFLYMHIKSMIKYFIHFYI